MKFQEKQTVVYKGKGATVLQPNFANMGTVKILTDGGEERVVHSWELASANPKPATGLRDAIVAQERAMEPGAEGKSD